MAGLSEPITHPLTAIRVHRGWSLAKVATIVRDNSGGKMTAKRDKPWRWENLGIIPEMAAQYALAAELGVSRTTVDSLPWPQWLVTVDAEEPVDAAWSASTASDVLANVVQSALMDRRTFIATTAGALVAMAGTWRTAAAAPYTGTGRGAVTWPAVAHLEKRITELWHLDDALGGGGCLEVGVADLRLVSTLIRTRTYEPEVGLRLFQLAGALARFCGWAAFDAGRINAATRFWHAGLRSSGAGADPSHGVYALSNLALAAIYEGDGTTALQLLDQARTRVDPAQRVVLSMLDTWNSRAYALIGAKRAAAAVLNRADTLWDNRRDGDDPDWVYWMPQPSLTAEAGTALLHTGDYRAAERNLRDGLAGAADAGPRDRTLYYARLAETQALDGRLDEAAATTHTALDLSAGIDSARVRRRVDDVIELIPTQGRLRRELVDHRADAWAAA